MVEGSRSFSHLITGSNIILEWENYYNSSKKEEEREKERKREEENEGH